MNMCAYAFAVSGRGLRVVRLPRTRRAGPSARARGRAGHSERRASAARSRRRGTSPCIFGVGLQVGLTALPARPCPSSRARPYSRQRSSICARHWKGPSRNVFPGVSPVDASRSPSRARRSCGRGPSRRPGSLRSVDAEVGRVHRQRGVLAEQPLQRAPQVGGGHGRRGASSASRARVCMPAAARSPRRSRRSRRATPTVSAALRRRRSRLEHGRRIGVSSPIGCAADSPGAPAVRQFGHPLRRSGHGRESAEELYRPRPRGRRRGGTAACAAARRLGDLPVRRRDPRPAAAAAGRRAAPVGEDPSDCWRCRRATRTRSGATRAGS